MSPEHNGLKPMLQCVSTAHNKNEIRKPSLTIGAGAQIHFDIHDDSHAPWNRVGFDEDRGRILFLELSFVQAAELPASIVVTGAVLNRDRTRVA